MNNSLHYSPTSRNNAPSVHGAVPFSYLVKLKVMQAKEEFAHPQHLTTMHIDKTPVYLVKVINQSKKEIQLSG